MKIAYVLPSRTELPVRMHRKSKAIFPPGSLIEVAGATDPEYEAVLFDELVHGPMVGERIPKADLYALSYLSTARKGAYRRADELLCETGKPVIAGGMDVTCHFLEGNQEEMLSHYSAIFLGRLTKASWRKVLADVASGNLQKVYQADSSEPWEFMLPRHDLIDSRDYFFPAAARSSAGCNEACPFCTVHAIIGERRRVMVKPPELYEQEIAILPESRFFADTADSFGANYSHTLDILSIDKNSQKEWLTEITIKNLLGIPSKDEYREPLVERMGQSGCAWVYIGIESIKGPIGGKSPDIRVAEEAIARIHAAGMGAAGSFMLDVTGREVRDDFRRTVDWAKKNKVDYCQFSLTALLPGSETRRVALLNGWLTSRNPEHLDGAWPTKMHPILSEAELIDGINYCYRRFYSLPNIIRRVVRAPWGRKSIVAKANAQVHLTAKGWAKVATYEHWLETRDLSG